MVRQSRLLFGCLLLFVGCGGFVIAEDEPAGAKDEVLNRFVGVWDLSSKLSPSKWNPDGGDFTGKESTVWALKNRVILIRDQGEQDELKGLYVATYDPVRQAYPFWCFNSDGLLGTKWELKWDAKSSSAIGHSTDSPADWKSTGRNHFPDADTNLVTISMSDETGALLLKSDSKKSRLTADKEAAIIAAWKKHEPATDLPAELKVLEHSIGTWDTVSIQNPAEWTPEGGRSTATVTREWILNGRFLMDTSIHSNGDESLALATYDPSQREYRSWWFNSKGHRNESRGTWNAAAQTMTYHTDLEEGRTMSSTVRFAGPDREVFHFIITDAAGKVFFDMDITATKRAAARVKGADQSKQ